MAQNVRQIKKKRRTKRKWIWDGMFKEGSVNILVGEQSRGKSMLATGLSGEMVKSHRGHAYLGRGVRPCKILYVTTEMPSDSIVERLEAIGIDGRVRKATERFFVYHQSTPTVEDIEREIMECNPDFVIIDILGNLMLGEGLDVNSYSDFNIITTKLKKLGKTFLLIHHMNKQLKAMGSIGALSSMDTRMEMLETSREEDEEHKLIIKQRIHAYGKDIKDQYIDVAFKYPTFELAAAEEVEELDKPLSKLMQSVILASINKDEGESIGFEGTYQEVAARCNLLEKYQFNPKKMGLLLSDNADTLRLNNIFYETKRMNYGYHLKIWYDANGADTDDLGGENDGPERTDLN